MLPDSSLARLAREGEAEAFEELVRRHAPMVIAAARRITLDTGLAEDAAQEAFWKAHRALPAYREQEQFAAWLRQIAVRCALDLVRRRRPESELPGPDFLPAGGREERRHEDRELLEFAFRRIAPRDRAILLATKVDGQSVADIARELSMTKTAVRVRSHRALRRLRKILKEAI